METHLLTCDNLGMTRDMSISSLAKGEDGSTNYAFENHNIRILAVNDNTKFTVTNEKSTKLEDSIQGYFLGGCTCGRYLVLFITKPAATHPDYIYRLEYNGTVVNKVQLYNGNLGFSMDHPIEAIGYYESEEIQKVYWVDGLNQNRFINIVSDSVSYTFNDLSNPNGRIVYTKRLPELDITLTPSDGENISLYAFGSKSRNVPFYYSDILPADSSNLDNLWRKESIDYLKKLGSYTVSDVENAKASGAGLWYVRELSDYNDYSFNFQGQLTTIPTVKITKSYDKVGTFQAGVLQYFITYYNKYGVETCLVWNSDLQYISLNGRGGKADEDVSCAFDIEISNIISDTDPVPYDYLRIYANYRSGINGVVSSRIVTDISLAEVGTDSVIVFTDYGSAGINFNAEDIPYIGGQDCRANTLDYKQDTLFLGDITIKSAVKNIDFPKTEVIVTDDNNPGGFEEDEVIIQEGAYTDGSSNVTPFITWAYKFVSPIASDGVYQYDQEILKSQKDIAGFKYRELYRFGIQFMTTEGEWTPAFWLGDKLCTLSPRTFMETDIYVLANDGTKTNRPKDSTYGYYTLDDNETHFYYEGEGCYIATPVVNIDAIKSAVPEVSDYLAYRLLLADTNITNRRIVEQGVVNPTMFNYVDRYYNRPFSIPSWIFRPRMSKITNKHYDTLPIQTESNAELQGIVKRQVPGYSTTASGGKYNSYLFLIGVNSAVASAGFVQWKLIYYNGGNTDVERGEKGQLLLYSVCRDVNDTDYRFYIAGLVVKYQLPLQKETGAPHEDIYIPASWSDQNIVATIDGKLANGYVPISVYGTDYKIVSNHMYSNDPVKWKSWEEIRQYLVSTLKEDMESTTVESVGEELAGKIVLSSAMLPDDKQLRKMSEEKTVDTTGIWLAIAAAITTAAAIVLSAISFGTAAPAAVLAASLAISAAVSVLSATSIGLGAAAAAEIVDSQLSDTLKELSAKGYIPVNTDYSLDGRQASSKQAAYLLERHFKVDTVITNSDNDWYVPVLNGDSSDIGHSKQGNVPFTTKHPYTATGRLGMDYNIFSTGGLLSALNDDEYNLKNKQNLFCVDEAIVTLNAPDIEDVANAVDSASGYRLDLVGLIPIQATYGTYRMIVDKGLNTSSQVLQGRDNTNSIGQNPMEALGMLNGLLYQDFKYNGAFTSVTSDNPAQVQETVDIYKVFMWNRRIAGFWFPGIALVDGLKEPVSEPRSNIFNKVFANTRYSTNTQFFAPSALDIENPVVCLDTQTMLKNFNYGGDIKHYYENVDTISANNSVYPLVINTGNYPSEDSDITKGALKDPITIRYRETPHIVLPIAWDYTKNASRILPRIVKETESTPYTLYGDSLGDTVLDGTYGSKSLIKTQYYYYNTSVSWSYDSTDLEVDSDEETAFFDLMVDIKDTLKNVSRLSTLSTLIDTMSTSSEAAIISCRNTVRLVLTRLQNFIFKASNNKYYLVNKKESLLTVHEVDSLIENARVTYFSGTGNTYAEEIKYFTKTYMEYVLPGNDHYVDITNGVGKIGPSLPSNLSVQPSYAGHWTQDVLSWDYDGVAPYLFLGELVKKNFDYDSWNGGTSDYALQQLVWNVVSEVTPMDEVIKKAWGDTYYQRWDCEKTYPFTEEDTNSNVEVLSFMLESHKNLDGRCDVNRGIHNILNTRPSNTIFNEVYGQKDNFFTYQMLDDKFSKQHFEADITWSLTKNNLDTTDNWTNIIATNEMSLDGRYGPLRKILNVNDTLVTFQDRGIAQIKYNESAALSTTSGLPVQMGNTGKVDGYRMLSDTIGCVNKFSINKNSAGVFFADDFSKSFNQFTINGGIVDISTRANFSTWFKKNLNGHLWDASTRDNFRTSYDEITHDLYITKNNECLVYNTLLQKFTSFMDYKDTPIITRLMSDNGTTDTFAIHSTTRSNAPYVETWKMFAGASTEATYGSQGAYGYIYGSFKPYSMEYRLNPDPLHDSIFTNYQYAADWIDPAKEVEEENAFNDSAVRRYTTFDTVEAKNEYQKGTMAIQQSGNTAGNTTGLKRVFGRQPIKSMFRLWRGDIPRNGDTVSSHTPLSDRMRNPWIHLKFTKSTADDSKMKFHNLMVNYYNQYGRF